MTAKNPDRRLEGGTPARDLLSRRPIPV